MKRSLERKLAATPTLTVDAALRLYAQHLERKGNKPRSRTDTLWRIRKLLGVERCVDDDTDQVVDDFPLAELTPKRAAALYAAVVDAKVAGEDGTERPRYAPDSHRNMLAETKTFLGWCVAQKHLRANPLEDVAGVGRRRHGKPQLRIDEARRWMAAALELAEREVGAVAALVSLVLGMRASEIILREARDVDDGGRLLWIPDAKTAAGRRTLEVPEVLQPHLVALAAGKLPTARLFGYHVVGWVRAWVRQICDAAKVPVVCAHAMRGLHATLARGAPGVTGRDVAAQLGHESPSTTDESYTSPTAIEEVRQRRVLTVLQGGRTKA